MTAEAKSPGEGDRRVEELLRVNAELAAEIRNLALDRAARPRSGLLGASRRLATMAEEREAAEESLAERNAELDRLRPGVEELQRRVEELQRRANVQARELERLRAGPLGLIRRAKARLMRSRG